MRIRRFVIGLFLVALVLGAGAAPADAKAVLGIQPPPKPTAQSVEALAKSMVPAKPTIIVPGVPDPNNLTFPILPYVAIPPGARPALEVLSPTTVVTCQVSYLGPLVAIVALSKVMSTVGQNPVQPSFLSPAFGPVSTVCIAAPFPSVTSCGPDGKITSELASLPSPPAVPGGVPSVDPFSSVPAPFASVVVEIGAVQDAIGYYVYGNSVHIGVEHDVATKLGCS